MNAMALRHFAKSHSVILSDRSICNYLRRSFKSQTVRPDGTILIKNKKTYLYDGNGQSLGAPWRFGHMGRETLPPEFTKCGGNAASKAVVETRVPK